MENKEIKSKKSKSGSFPVVSLEEAVKLIEKGSSGGFAMSKDTFAKAIGGSTANSGSFIVKLGALREYGFLERGGTIVYTQLAKEVVAPKNNNPEEIKSRLKEAFFHSDVFSELYQKIKEGLGESSSSTIANLGVHDFKIALFKKEIFSRNFVNSGKYADLLEETTEGKIKIIKEQESKNMQNDPFNFTSQVSTGEKAMQPGIFNDSGTGWSLSLKSSKPLNSKIRKVLVEIAQILEDEINK